jgi:hypothetical protein
MCEDQNVRVSARIEPSSARTWIVAVRLVSGIDLPSNR